MRIIEGNLVAEGLKIGIVVGRFNEFIGSKLLGGALDGWKRHGVEENNIDVAIANKESIVVGGELINNILKNSKAKLYPIDSEHVALNKCLKGNYKDVAKLILTASGGAFRSLNRDQLKNVTKEDALKHPSWTMGEKITIDCATMMNKGFEIVSFILPFILGSTNEKKLVNCPLGKIISFVKFFLNIAT